MMSEPVVLLLGVGVVTSGNFTQPSSMSAVMTGESRPRRDWDKQCSKFRAWLGADLNSVFSDKPNTDFTSQIGPFWSEIVG